MNLSDVIDPEYGLQQDEWSLSKPTFGEEGQLEVVGWSGKCGTIKLYILKCNKCSQDSELFGEGYFMSVKNSLVNLIQVPCSCSKKPHWSKDQYTVLCSRKAKELGYIFLDFVGEWKGQNTKIKMSCDKHGKWSSGSINNLINKGQGCPMCKAEVNTKPDEEMVASFFASGSFHPDTKFWRSGRKDSKGTANYWFMDCPECEEIGESYRGNLQAGCRPCACSKQRQQECYINWVIDGGNSAVAIKFGIANNSKQRIKQQDSKSAYTLKQHSVYSFPSVASCKAAERECKQTLECGVILKRDMPDGYSETTWVYNLEKIKSIYEKHGGVLKDE